MLLRTLGGVALPGASFRRLKPLLMLAYLALEGPKERRYLAELFWPDAADPRQSLAVAVWQLRRASPGVLSVDDRVIAATVECDAVLLREAAIDGEWRDVVDLYGGPFLDGADVDAGNAELEEWLYGTREALSVLTQNALIALAEEHLSVGDLRGAARLSERAATVVRDLATAQPESLSRLHALLVATGNPRSVAVAKEAAAFGVTLSEHADRAAAATDVPLPEHNLPNLIAPFVGRDQELRDLEALLERGERLVTITGLGGMGKTRLAMALARRMVSGRRFTRVYFVPCGVERPDQVLTQVAAVTAPRTGAPALTSLRRTFGDESALLVLDDLDQVAGDAQQLGELLEACPLVRLVVTSREPLGLTAESLYPLGGLPLPGSAAEALAGTGETSGLDLYVLTARRFDPRFTLEQANARLVLDICRRLAGAPLGIELAASLSSVISPEELERELEADLDTLVSVRPTTNPRHTSLRVVFERSWSLLSDAERGALSGCSVFQGGFTRVAAAAVLQMDVRLLTALLDRSLVWRAGGRYDLHPLVKQYAGEKLKERPDADELRARHAEHFCGLVESKSRFALRAGQSAAFDELDRDHANVRAAWDWAGKAGRHDVLERMLPMLGSYLADRRPSDERIRTVDAALGRVDPDSALTARLLLERGQFLTYVDPSESRKTLVQALLLARRHLGERRAGPWLYALGRTLMHLGDLPGARSAYREAAEQLAGSADEQLLGGCLSNLAMTSTDPREMERLFTEAISVCRRTGNVSYLVKVLLNLGGTLVDAHGDYAGALALLREALALERAEIGRPQLLIYLGCVCAHHLATLGDLEAAEQQLADVRDLTAPRVPWDVAPWMLAMPSNWARVFIHYARGEEDLVRSVGAQVQDETVWTLLAWMALDEGDTAAAAPYLHSLVELSKAPCDARTGLRLRASAILLSARSEALEAASSLHELEGNGSNPGLPHLLEALEIIAASNLVPLAFEAFIVAHAIAPDVVGREWLELAASQTRAPMHARRRAGYLLGGSPEGEGVPPSPTPVGAGGLLTSEAVVEATRDLKRRLSSATPRNGEKPS